MHNRRTHHRYTQQLLNEHLMRRGYPVECVQKEEIGESGPPDAFDDDLLHPHGSFTPEPAAGLGADNHFGYSSPQVDRLLLAARTAPTLLDRRQALQRAMERVMTDLPMVPLVVPHDLYVLRRDVRWTPRLDGRVLAADLAREPGGPL